MYPTYKGLNWQHDVVTPLTPTVNDRQRRLGPARTNVVWKTAAVQSQSAADVTVPHCRVAAAAEQTAARHRIGRIVQPWANESVVAAAGELV